MKTIKFLTVALAACAFVACSSSNKRYPDQTTKVDLSGKSVLIVAEDNASGDAAAAKAFAAAVGQKLGTVKIVPSVPAAAQGISRTYAQFGLNNQGVVDATNVKVLALDQILQLSAKMGKFDTIVFVSAEKSGGLSIPKTISIDLFAAVYDINAKKVTAAVTDTTTTADTGLVAQMPLKARDIVSALLDGSPAK